MLAQPFDVREEPQGRVACVEEESALGWVASIGGVFDGELGASVVGDVDDGCHAFDDEA